MLAGLGCGACREVGGPVRLVLEGGFSLERNGFPVKSSVQSPPVACKHHKAPGEASLQVSQCGSTGAVHRVCNGGERQRSMGFRVITCCVERRTSWEKGPTGGCQATWVCVCGDAVMLRGNSVD